MGEREATIPDLAKYTEAGWKIGSVCFVLVEVFGKERAQLVAEGKKVKKINVSVLYFAGSHTMSTFFEFS